MKELGDRANAQAQRDLARAFPDRFETCRACGGHGADPASDNVNWLPCRPCAGSGKRRVKEAPQF